jgi:hypothetical protein
VPDFLLKSHADAEIAPLEIKAPAGVRVIIVINRVSRADVQGTFDDVRSPINDRGMIVTMYRRRGWVVHAGVSAVVVAAWMVMIGAIGKGRSRQKQERTQDRDE